jgi:aspartate aminotransferase
MPISELVRKGIQRDAIVQNLQKEATTQSARLGADKVFDLTPDYPILEPPASFNLSLQQLFEIPHNGLHRYMENAGYTDTRSRIAAELKQQTGLNFSQAEVIMTSGATGALNMALKAVLNPGEEVVLFAPLAYDYEAYVSNHAGTARIIPCGRDFLPDLDVFEAALTPRTKLVILNTPNNPSGAVYPEQTLEAIAGIIKRRSAAFSTRIYTVSDDSYRKFYYGEGTCPWILKHYPHPSSSVLTPRSFPFPASASVTPPSVRFVRIAKRW